MEHANDLLERAEGLANSEATAQFAVAFWNDPAVSERFEQRPAETLAEFGVKVPKELDVVPLGSRTLGKPTPDWTPFQIRFSRCRTMVVRDPDSGRLKTETVCFGFEIVPNHVPGGPIG